MLNVLAIDVCFDSTLMQLALQVCQAEASTGSRGWAGSAHVFGAGTFTQDGQRQRSQVCAPCTCTSRYSDALVRPPHLCRNIGVSRPGMTNMTSLHGGSY